MKFNLERSSFLVTVLAVGSLFMMLLVTACRDSGEDGVWIPVPKDTSSLAKIDHFIPLSEIARYQKIYGVERDSLSKLAPRLYLPLSEAFNKPALLELLKNPECVGLKIYYGAIDSSGMSDFRLMIVGVNQQGKDLYIKQGSVLTAQTKEGQQGGLEYGQCYPPCTLAPPTSK